LSAIDKSVVHFFYIHVVNLYFIEQFIYILRSSSLFIESNKAAQSFPTPMEEPKKVLRAQYLGSLEVASAVGMNTINDAIDKISSETAPESWQSVNVSISPSVISIRPSGVSEQEQTICI
jgi:hypothetical protein